MFTACHPCSRPSATALTLRLLAADHDEMHGLPGAKATIAQRIVRAKRTLARARPLRGAAWSRARARLSSVLEVIYSSSTRLRSDRRRRLDATGAVRDALRLGRILAELVPQEPEVHASSR